VILNKATDAQRSFERLSFVAGRFLSRDLRLLGEVPRNQAMVESVTSFLPIVDGAPDSPAARVFDEISLKLDTEISRLKRLRERPLRARVGGRGSEELPDLSKAAALTP
jgi:MinD-like ATPase involved in chromosome partitioning or flagellar assembly